MPRANIDWLSIQRDWLAGATHAELSTKHQVALSSIQSRSKRHKWRNASAEATLQAESKIKHAARQGALSSLQGKVKDRSDRFIDRLTEDIENKTEQLIARGKKEPQPDYDVLLAHEQVREKLVSSGRKMFGLDQQERPTISLGIAINLPAPTVGATDGKDGVIEFESNAQDQLIEPITPLGSEDV